jgi:AcrR family transcriptional regulator
VALVAADDKGLFSAVGEHFQPRQHGQGLQLGICQFAKLEDVVGANVCAVAGPLAFVRVDRRGDDLGGLFAFGVCYGHRLVLPTKLSYCSFYMSVCSDFILVLRRDMATRTRKVANPRKRPEQDRSRATVEAVMDAAAHILIKHGYDAFTTNRVAEKAGVSIGSLYQYFPNKEALIGELMRRHLAVIEQGVELMAAQAHTVPLAVLVRAAVEQNIASHLAEPALHRVLSEEVPRLGQLDWQRAFQQRVTARVREALDARRAELAVADLDLAVYVVTRTVEAVVHNAVGERPQDLKSGVLAEELTRLLVGYLMGKPTAAKRPFRAAAE